MMIDIHRKEVTSLRRQIAPGMLLTADGRLDVKRRVAESEGWVKRWAGRLKQLRE
jgi:hypothetical protein